MSNTTYKSGADGYGDIGAGDTAQSTPASQSDPDSPQPSNPALDGYHSFFKTTQRFKLLSLLQIIYNLHNTLHIFRSSYYPGIFAVFLFSVLFLDPAVAVAILKVEAGMGLAKASAVFLSRIMFASFCFSAFCSPPDMSLKVYIYIHVMSSNYSTVENPLDGHLHQWDTLRYRHQSPNPLGNSVL